MNGPCGSQSRLVGRYKHQQLGGRIHSKRTDGGLQGDNWNDLLKEVVTFDSVEEFWGVYVRPPLLWTYRR